jgi:hypothetical protein
MRATRAMGARSARESALVHLVEWTIAAERLPAGATLLEPVDSSASWWAIRHPRSGAVFGWHADPDRLVRLYWEALGEEERLELVAEAVARVKSTEHLLKWKCAWSNWTHGFGARVRAAEWVAAAWADGDKRGLERALAALAEVVYPDPDREPAAPGPGAATELDAFSLGLASAALVEGDDQLARLIYAYSLVAVRDRRQVPALLEAAAAVADRLSGDPGQGRRR